VTARELAFLLAGISIGLSITLVIGWLQRKASLRAEKRQQDMALARQRAQRLRAKLERAVEDDGWRLEEEAVFSALFSDNEIEPPVGEPVGSEGKATPNPEPSETETPSASGETQEPQDPRAQPGRQLKQSMRPSLGSSTQQ
jgi:hypothetical protein